MPKTEPEAKPFQTMDAAALKRRGNAVDDMQQRVTVLLNSGKEVPAEYTAKLRELVETDNAVALADIEQWMAAELPPKEYMVAEVTWQTFDHFSSALLERLAMYDTVQKLLNRNETAIVQALMLEIAAVPDAVQSPVMAMSELAKIRARARSTLKHFAGDNVTG